MTSIEEEVRLVGRNEQPDRDLYLAVVDDLESWSADLSTVPTPFAVVCALDAGDASVDAVSNLASRLLAAGCTNVCAWGPRCEWVHDIFDAVIVGEAGEFPYGDNMMTTWHVDQSLDETLWFAIFVAGGLSEEPLLLTLVSPPYAEQVGRRLADTAQLERDVLAGEPD